MKIKELLKTIDEIAPFSLAEEWDRCGLRLGSDEESVTGVAVSLDPSQETVKQTADLGFNVLLTHHPLAFRPLENLVCDRPDVRTAAEAFRRGINIVACHTNLDSARGGINDTLAASAGLRSVEPLVPAVDGRGFGMGAVGLADARSCGDLCATVAAAWELSGYRLLGKERSVGTIALCGGAGGDLWSAALQKGAELYITADMKYHECLEALDAGLNLMICDHGEMENSVLKPFAERLAQRTGLPVNFIDAVAPFKARGRWVAREIHV
ncbi:MAG: Nif3-like dinuclear metal center hexameric protein [Pyramidobacter sp.]|jgi:dinuclear metal center YbgI/SA1388 family protein